MGDRTPIEQRLIRSVERGEVLDLSGSQTTAVKEEMQAWSEERTVRASVIRDILRGQLAKDADPLGLRLHGARLSGRLNLRHVRATIPLELRNCYIPAGAELSCAQLESVDLSSSRLEQGLTLANTRISGQLAAQGACVVNDAGPALVAHGLKVDYSLFLSEGFTARGSSDSAAVRLDGAVIGGNVQLSGASIVNDSGPALVADGLKVEHSLFLDRFTARGSSDSAAVRLVGADIGGQLIAPGAKIFNDLGPALAAGVLIVEGGLLMSNLTATGAGDVAFRLSGAHVRGQLDASGATITNHSGAALDAESLQVDQNLLLSGCTIAGAGEGGVRLPGAHIRGKLDASGATITNRSGPAIDAENLQADEGLYLSDGFSAIGMNQAPVVRLDDACVGVLALDLTAIRDTSGEPGILSLDGLVYGHQPRGGVSLKAWLAVLADRTPRYSAQPYQQFAAVTRAVGHDGDTRKILMAQRRDQLSRRAITTFAERAWGKATRVLLGYGYQPWRALVGLLITLVAAVALTVIVGGHRGGLNHTNQTTRPGSACSTVEQIGVGIDLGLPLIKTNAHETCTTSTTHAGRVIMAGGWALQALAWALATLFVAGFTGAVRKT